jgi:hypothetical protein
LTLSLSIATNLYVAIRGNQINVRLHDDELELAKAAATYYGVTIPILLRMLLKKEVHALGLAKDAKKQKK